MNVHILSLKCLGLKDSDTVTWLFQAISCTFYQKYGGGRIKL